MRKSLKNINFLNIESIKTFLLKINKKKFIIDKNSCSIFFENIISKNNLIINSQDPIYFLKAIKDKKEIENIKTAHIYDGAALTKYLFWLKKNFKNKKINEISGSENYYNSEKK